MSGVDELVAESLGESLEGVGLIKENGVVGEHISKASADDVNEAGA